MGTLSAPDFITGRFHDPDTFIQKDNDSGRFGKCPESGGTAVAQAESIPGFEWKGLVVKMIQ